MGRVKINSYFTAREFWPPARRERRAYPARGSVRNEQRSPRPKEPAGKCEVIFARPLTHRQKDFRPNSRQARPATTGSAAWAREQLLEVVVISFLNVPVNIGSVCSLFVVHC